MFVRVITEVLVVNRALVTSILAPLGPWRWWPALFAWVYFRRSATPQSEAASGDHEVSIKNPFSLTAAAKFAAFFTAVLLVVKIVQQNLPANGASMSWRRSRA